MAKLNWNRLKVEKQMAVNEDVRFLREASKVRSKREIKKVPQWIIEKRKQKLSGLRFCSNRFCTTAISEKSPHFFCDFHRGR